MLWINSTPVKNEQPVYVPFAYRFCKLYISDRFQQIIFTPFGRLQNGLYAELDIIIVDTWPCEFEDLQSNIEETLKRFSDNAIYVEGKWPSYDCSKAKSHRSFETEYIPFRLETDLSRSYGESEVECIKVSAQPTVIDKTYALIGEGHLHETRVAQIVLDISEACFKIRN